MKQLRYSSLYLFSFLAIFTISGMQLQSDQPKYIAAQVLAQFECFIDPKNVAPSQTTPQTKDFFSESPKIPQKMPVLPPLLITMVKMPAAPTAKAKQPIVLSGHYRPIAPVPYCPALQIVQIQTSPNKNSQDPCSKAP